MSTSTSSATGKIVQIIGAVIDVEFPREAIPKVFEALKLEDSGRTLTLEVQQRQSWLPCQRHGSWEKRAGRH